VVDTEAEQWYGQAAQQLQLQLTQQVLKASNNWKLRPFDASLLRFLQSYLTN